MKKTKHTTSLDSTLDVIINYRIISYVAQRVSKMFNVILYIYKEVK
jgi:hypothetical protein